MHKLTAVIEQVKEPETFRTRSGGDFTKQEVILFIDGKYPNYLAIELTGDQVDTIRASDEGRKAEFSFFINGRKGSGKYADRVFMSLRYADHSFVEDGDQAASEPESEQESNDDELPF